MNGHTLARLLRLRQLQHDVAKGGLMRANDSQRQAAAEAHRRAAALAALQLPALATALRTGRVRGRAPEARLLADMRRYLRQLPETQHPLDR